MKAKMWIAKIDRYIEPVEIDDNCSLYEDDMEKEVTCPWSGKKVPYGETYTSQVFHTSLGMGYAVCKECYPHDMWFYRMNKWIGDKEDE